MADNLEVDNPEAFGQAVDSLEDARPAVVDPADVLAALCPAVVCPVVVYLEDAHLAVAFPEDVCLVVVRHPAVGFRAGPLASLAR